MVTDQVQPIYLEVLFHEHQRDPAQAFQRIDVSPRGKLLAPGSEMTCEQRVPGMTSA